jgi:galactokinase
MPTTHTALADLLAPAYGTVTPAQITRYTAALAKFRRIYGPGPVLLLRAPGRVNIIGEHTDYNHGFVLPAALDKDIVILARPRADQTDPTVRAANIEDRFAPTEFTLAPTIPSAERGHWSNYLRGPAQMIAAQARERARGADLLIVGAPPTGVPRAAGLSSSSAVVVAAAITLSHLAELPNASPDFAQACADAEWYVGTRGGIMDHFAAILTQPGHALFLDCRPQTNGAYHTRHIPFPAGYSLLVVDSGVHHDNVRGQYNLRVAACRAGVALLRAFAPAMTHLRDIQELPWADLESRLPEVTTAADLAAAGIDLGEIPGLDPNAPLRVRANVRHVWHENARVLEAIGALAVNDVTHVGALLTAAHHSAAADYGISTPELDFLVETANAQPGVVGARLTGAGWGGCVVILAHSTAVTDLERTVGAAYAQRFGRTPAIFPCQAGPGAGYLGNLTV